MQRYSQIAEKIKTYSGVRRYETIYYPEIPYRDSDIYIITKRTDRLDLLANEYYGDPRYWVILARANNYNNATIKPPIGDRMRIPYPYTEDDIEKLFTEAQT